jgi:hypothetical protein
MTHTPGPHTYTVIKLTDQHDAFDWAVARDGAVLLGELPSKSMARYQSERDAQAHADNLARLERKAVVDRLHAAAPDLLDVAKEALAYALGSGTQAIRTQDHIAKLRAAIAKAEGVKDA